MEKGEEGGEGERGKDEGREALRYGEDGEDISCGPYASKRLATFSQPLLVIMQPCNTHTHTRIHILLLGL